MKLWVDECLSPTLVHIAHQRHHATCNQYEGLLHIQDDILEAILAGEEWALVTNNERDIRSLTKHTKWHSGLIVLPQRTRNQQILMLAAVLEHIQQCSDDASLEPAAWMTNRLVEYHEPTETVSDRAWPPA